MEDMWNSGMPGLWNHETFQPLYLTSIKALAVSTPLRRYEPMLGFQKIIEQKIKEASLKGEFDDLPGKGKPIKLEDESHLPDDLRLTYKILKNANCLPPELQLKKEIRHLEDMLENMPDERERYRQIKRINFKITQLNMMGKGSPLLEENELYYAKLVEKGGNK
ncbi:MAG: DnaJ family domain-containing protein [Desulfatiglans sp.]|jgi:hypothetical protein|nr:DnaJ family domain-containing protein [Thermodesulfobacteriota bacterium]MEE4351871.1 DnaJ family domain-containing protein [Desulfatiglans sp.]